MAVSLGVKVTPWLPVPALGEVLVVVKAKDPAVLAVPPLSMELANVCPYVIALAVGAAEIVGVALAMLNVRFAAELVPAEFEAVTATTVPFPAAVGVPEITPVVALRESPVGSVPLLIA